MSNSKKSIVLIVLSMIAGLVYLVPFMRYTFYDQMIEALGITDIQMGTMGAFYGIYALFFIPSGMLAARFNTKKLLILSTFMMGAVTIWYSTYPSFEQLCIIHLLYGIFSVGTFWSPYLKAIRNLGSDAEQGRLFGMSEGIRGIAQTVVSFASLGVLAAAATSAAGFKAALYVNAAAFFLLMIGVIIFVPDFDKEAKETASEEPEENLLLQIKTTMCQSSTWICILVLMSGYTLWSTANGYMGTYSTRVLGLSNELASTVSIIRSYVIVFVAGFTGGFIMDRFSTKGKGMILFFGITLIFSALMFVTSGAVMLNVGITLVLGYLINVIKATYWSIMGEAGVTVKNTAIATGAISFIALTGDLYVSPIVSRFLAYGESIGDIKVGFDIMIVWMLAWSALGIVSGFILRKRAIKNKQLAEK